MTTGHARMYSDIILYFGRSRCQKTTAALPHIAQAQLWIPILTVALFIAFMVGLPLGGEGQEWLPVGVVALLTAVVTGAGFVWLARGGKTAVTA